MNDAPSEQVDISHMFLFLGAEPNISWLGDCVNLDQNGFVLTGQNAGSEKWSLKRAPYYLETSRRVSLRWAMSEAIR